MKILIALAAAAATIALSAPAAQAATFGAHWALDEQGTPSPTQAFDDLHGNTGTVRNVIGDGIGYTFGGSSGVSGVSVPDSDSLSPGSADFSYTVQLITTVPAPGTDYDVLRKGLASTVGGEYKIEVLNVNGVAKAMCLVKDSAKHVARIQWSPKGGIADGKIHTITCSKTSTGITLTLDGSSHTKVNSAGIGTVANTGSLFIGIKSDSGGDQFVGKIIDARLG
jgi:hypothetical protein